tara:strand:- start:6292 stop:7119 length:828 start_codon:yes stop_codon:yes gene_type:complete
MIEVQQLTVTRGNREILQDINLKVTPGEVRVVIGANGAGKSTLLETIAGDLPAAQGTILIDNRPLNQWPAPELAQHRAVLRQSPRLDLRFTVLEVILMGRSPHIKRYETKADLQIAHDALAVVNLEGFADRFYTQLSGGEQQRVHLARVLAQVWTPALLGQDADDNSSERYLLFDEPTSNLDVHAQHLVLECVRRFARVGGTVLCVLHDINLASQYADQILLLKNGRVLADGPPVDVLQPNLLHKAFGVEGTIIESPQVPHPVFVVRPQKEISHE